MAIHRRQIGVGPHRDKVADNVGVPIKTSPKQWRPALVIWKVNVSALGAQSAYSGPVSMKDGVEQGAAALGVTPVHKRDVLQALPCFCKVVAANGS